MKNFYDQNGRTAISLLLYFLVVISGASIVTTGYIFSFPEEYRLYFGVSGFGVLAARFSLVMIASIALSRVAFFVISLFIITQSVIKNPTNKLSNFDKWRSFSIHRLSGRSPFASVLLSNVLAAVIFVGAIGVSIWNVFGIIIFVFVPSVLLLFGYRFRFSRARGPLRKISVLRSILLEPKVAFVISSAFIVLLFSVGRFHASYVNKNYMVVVCGGGVEARGALVTRTSNELLLFDRSANGSYIAYLVPTSSTTLRVSSGPNAGC